MKLSATARVPWTTKFPWVMQQVAQRISFG